MIIAIIDVTYLDTWVWRVQDSEDEGEDGGEDEEDPAELTTLPYFSPALFSTIDILHIRYVDTPKSRNNNFLKQTIFL